MIFSQRNEYAILEITDEDAISVADKFSKSNNFVVAAGLFLSEKVEDEEDVGSIKFFKKIYNGYGLVRFEELKSRKCTYEDLFVPEGA